MCIATLIPAGVDIPWTALENGSIVNDDGHGFAIASKALGLEVFKSMKYDETASALEEARERHGSSSIVVFHSRFATHGTTNEFNIHPFYTDESEQTVMVHNGVLPLKFHPTGKDARSDTRIFASRVASEVTRNGVPSRRAAANLGSIIGMGNKLIFLSVATGEPKVRIVNAFLGEQEYGCWFSNTGYQTRSYRYGGTWHGGRYGSAWDMDEVTDEEASIFHRPQYVNTDCKFCQGVETVDAFTTYCDVCDMCQDCDSILRSCVCYGTTQWSENRWANDDDDDVLVGETEDEIVTRIRAMLDDQPQEDDPTQVAQLMLTTGHNGPTST